MRCRFDRHVIIALKQGTKIVQFPCTAKRNPAPNISAQRLTELPTLR